MKRDMDLIRALVLRMEDQPSPALIEMSLVFEGHTDEEVKYHVYLMQDAGLVKAMDLKTTKAIAAARPLCLTWAGHEFASAARSDTVWDRTKKKIEKAVGVLGAAGFGILMDVLKEELKARLGM